MNETEIFRTIIQEQRNELLKRIESRRVAMEADDTSYYLLFKALGIKPGESSKIDLYQNLGRFVYRHAGTLLERMAATAIQLARGGEPITIENNISANPKTFKIDSYVSEDNKAHEIKWRDATTDGDHVRKERDKVLSMVKHELIPVRVMFYFPQRKQARRIQERILGLFKEYGEAYVEEDAWSYIKDYTGYDLFPIIREEAGKLL